MMKSENNVFRNKVIAASIAISSLFVNYFINEFKPNSRLHKEIIEIDEVLDTKPTYNQLLDTNYMIKLEELYKKRTNIVSSNQYRLEESSFNKYRRKVIPYVTVNTILGIGAIVYLLRKKPQEI